MRIAIIMPLAEQRGGGERMLMQCLEQSPAPRADWLTIFLEDGPMARAAAELGVTTAVVNAGRLREAPRFGLAVASIARLARRHGADLIFGWMPKAQLYGSPAAALAQLPALWFQIGTPQIHAWEDRLQALLPCKGILACSQASAQAQRRLSPVRPMRVVYPQVDLARFQPAALPSPEMARRRLGLPSDGPLIGIVGRLQRWKGIHVLIEAMPLVQRRYPAARCVVVGGEHSLEADYVPYLQRRIEALHLEETVLLAGARENVPEWMQAMDVVVHASDREPFGIVIVEAMALGKPIVAGLEGGPREIITPEVHGLLTPYGDASALASAVVRCLDEPALARALGAAAQERARDFCATGFPRRFVAAIGELMGAGHGVSEFAERKLGAMAGGTLLGRERR
jgi:glycosyltransferase involved in cell wall biosynthesis